MVSFARVLSSTSFIGSAARRLNGLIPVIAVVTALALAGCGSDDEAQVGSGPSAAPTPTTETEGTATVTQTETGTEEATETDPPAAEEQPPDAEDTEGGAGDEEPARVPAMFSGEDGRITPAVVRVPAFIAIRVELSSADGREYGLTFKGETVTVSGGLGSVSTTIDGLRPGETVVGVPTGGGPRVRIEASAEPGP